MKKLFYYSVMAVRDTFRLPGALMATTMIVLGISVPLVLMSGVTNGLVRQQEEAMLSSPTSTLTNLWVTSGQAPPLNREVEDRLASHPEILMVIPSIRKLIDVESQSNGKALKSVTLLSTKRGDPLLAFHRADVHEGGGREIVLSRSVADRLDVRYRSRSDRGFEVQAGQILSITVTRDEADGKKGTAQAWLEVKGVVDLGDGNVAYADRQVLDRIEDYQQGDAVVEWDWPAFPKNVAVSYDGYVCFSKAPMSLVDVAKIAGRGLTVAALDANNPHHAKRCSLGGLLQAHQLSVYYISAGSSLTTDTPRAFLSLTPQEVEEITDADDVVVPWSAPIASIINGKSFELVGVSLRRRWLRSFFVHEDSGFALGGPDLQVQFPVRNDGASGAAAWSDTIRLQLTGGLTIGLRMHRPAEAKVGVTPVAATLLGNLPAAALEVSQFGQALAGASGTGFVPKTLKLTGDYTSAIVPGDLLARLHAFERHEVTFDAALGMFIPIVHENCYYQARVYARTLNDVPGVDALLRKEGYTVQSERTRVEEIQGYARTLNLLVWVVGGTVSLFGIWTLMAVLSDNTSRKRGSLGILLGLGMSRMAILYFVLARALLIGVVAGVLTLPLGSLLARGVSTYVAPCELRMDELTSIVGVAIACCLLGGIIPAIRASRLDPVVAINDGNMR